MTNLKTILRRVGFCALMIGLSMVHPKNLSANTDAGALHAVMALVDRWQPLLDGAFGLLGTAGDAAKAVRALETLCGYGQAIHAEAAAVRCAWPQLRRIYLLPSLAPFFARIAPHVARYTAALDLAEKRFAQSPSVLAAAQRVRRLAGR